MAIADHVSQRFLLLYYNYFVKLFCECESVAIIHLNHQEATGCHAELQSQSQSNGSIGSKRRLGVKRQNPAERK